MVIRGERNLVMHRIVALSINAVDYHQFAKGIRTTRGVALTTAEINARFSASSFSKKSQ